MTKRFLLKCLASIYDPVGLIGPILVEGKHLYMQAVDEKRGWDSDISVELKKKWNRWLQRLKSVEVPRKIAPYLKDICQIILHHFMDASDKAVSNCCSSYSAKWSNSSIAHVKVKAFEKGVVNC